MRFAKRFQRHEAQIAREKHDPLVLRGELDQRLDEGSPHAALQLCDRTFVLGFVHGQVVPLRAVAP